MKRKQLFPSWDQQQFPELVSGSPVQVAAKLQGTGGGAGAEPGAGAGAAAGADSVTVTGTPACPGLVTGPARVITHISMAASIRPGDILVTHSTDIGWSPYFPVKIFCFLERICKMFP